MAISKRLRFEILKRDGNACRYCGAMAPEAKLTIDHVVPVALGGTDEPTNLVAACQDCNAGKASTSPEEAIVAQVGEDDMRWAEAIKRAGEKMLTDSRAKADSYKWFTREWSTWDTDCFYLPDSWKRSIDHWIGGGLPQEMLMECMWIAVRNRNVGAHDVFKYMGGIARNRIEELHCSAREILDGGEA